MKPPNSLKAAEDVRFMLFPYCFCYEFYCIILFPLFRREEKHEKENTHFFYIQDSNVKYEFNVEEVEEDEAALKSVENPHSFASSVRGFLNKKIVVKRR